MLAPQAVDITVIMSSLIASLCFTFAEPFDDIFLFVKSSCALVSGNTNKRNYNYNDYHSFFSTINLQKKEYSLVTKHSQ